MHNTSIYGSCVCTYFSSKYCTSILFENLIIASIIKYINPCQFIPYSKCCKRVPNIYITMHKFCQTQKRLLSNVSTLFPISFFQLVLAVGDQSLWRRVMFHRFDHLHFKRHPWCVSEFWPCCSLSNWWILIYRRVSVCSYKSSLLLTCNVARLHYETINCVKVVYETQIFFTMTRWYHCWK